ncbi:MAG: group III truncated hemoglobin [Bacteroidetes bacterium]|nr:group III truncated hemoglobin [Bacteroidota bacterium]MBS1629887.1 group III truncated hemoglobin [Bacteroidota bacterium]
MEPILNDIRQREDLVLLVNTFYGRVRRDESLGPIFNSIIGDQWERHLNIMYGFWDSVLFGAEGYRGQAVGKHVQIDKKFRLESEHYERWISLWRIAVQELFEGPNATLIQERAQAMLQLIQFKVEYARSGKTLY